MFKYLFIKMFGNCSKTLYSFCSYNHMRVKKMNNEIYKKLMQEARQLGGIALRHQTLKLHQNGAKFMISKSYVDDEILEVNMPYTMILIPESSADLISILTYFHPKKWTDYFCSSPFRCLIKDRYRCDCECHGSL